MISETAHEFLQAPVLSKEAKRSRIRRAFDKFELWAKSHGAEYVRIGSRQMIVCLNKTEVCINPEFLRSSGESYVDLWFQVVIQTFNGSGVSAPSFVGNAHSLEHVLSHLEDAFNMQQRES